MTPILISAALLVITVLICIAVARRDRSKFEERFPPISDAEYIARCRSGTSPEVALKVRRIVADNLGVEYERIHPSTRFVEGIGAD